MTDEDLIGYLVGALDDADRAAVEAQLLANPAATARLDSLRVLLAPLAADRDQTPPPAGLTSRTLARLAAHLAQPGSPARRPMPRAPREEPESRAMGGRFRPDVIVAACIGLVAVGFVFSAVGKLRARHELAACQNNLRVTHTALSGYADVNQGRYPRIGPDATAESFAAVLVASNQVPPNFRLVCPSCVVPEPSREPQKVTYTYTLGYRTPAGELVGLRRPDNNGMEHDLVPISADYPTPGAAPPAGPLCPHAFGMNVLFAGGHVQLTTSPLIGPNNDHIFLNLDGVIGAGIRRGDVVLGRPGDRP